jgi:hypothetical protein
MLASGKQAQHARSVCGIARLAENLAIDHDDGVSAEHNILRTLTSYCKRLLARQAFGTFLRTFSRQRIFGDIRSLHFKRNSSAAQ